MSSNFDLPGGGHWDGARAEAWRRPDGGHLWLRYLPARGAMVGRLVILHGYLEHGGRYARLAQLAAAAGIEVWVPDQRGHGRAGGRRGDIGSFALAAADLAGLGTRSATGTAPPPLWWVAHSHGGLVALWGLLCAGLSVDALVLSGPFLRLAQQRQSWANRLAPHLGRLMPRLAVPAQIADEELSRDAAEVARHGRDPWVLNHVRLSWARQAHLAQADLAAAGERGARLACRSLWWLADDDRLADPDYSAQMAARLAQQPRIERVADGRHELFFDRDGAQREAASIAWLLEGRSVADAPTMAPRERTATGDHHPPKGP